MRNINVGKSVAGVIAGLVMAALAVWGIMHVIAGMAYVTTDDAYVDGRVHAIASKVPGMVLKVHVTDNQPVKKGDVLIEIDAADYQARVKEAEAMLAAQAARVAEAQARVEGAQASFNVQAAVFKQAKLDQARAQRLFSQGVLSKEKLEKALTGFDLAQAQLAAAQEGIMQARSTVMLEKAQIETRQAALEAANLNKSYTCITAPADGMVTKKSAEQGNMVQPGQPMMAIVALDDIWVTANFKETQLEHVHVGQHVSLRVDTYPGRVFSGQVHSMMAGTGAAFSLFPPENALGNYVKVVQRIPVKIVFDKDADKAHELRVGMSVTAKIRVKEE
ncbi:MAG: HlyD family secretion protein [Candidatus Omnitrophica bacterium]|nr:HlyD family secretion protein [Candidatus Omnitrophota bacterium]